ncbi:IS110 family transposase [Arthrobacter sp. SLBN-100]|uniref:IS110 family transposase n=1 Tax=Arthrobacter sp. SLBN-100 TaxID=2768450 RepID=UPI003FA43EB1
MIAGQGHDGAVICWALPIQQNWRLFLVQLSAGIDAGKAHHHCFVIDGDGNRLLSQRVPDDEPALLQLLASVLEIAAGDLWFGRRT